MTAMTDLGFRARLDGYADESVSLQLQVNRRTAEQISRWRVDVDGIGDAEAVRAYQDRVRQAVLDGLGGLPEPEGSLNVRSKGTVEHGPLTIEKLIFESLPGVQVTANLYRAGRRDSPGPAVLFVCGHSPEAKADPQYQAVCSRLALTGLTVLAIDPFGQGERHAYLDEAGTPLLSGTAEHTHAGAPCWWAGQSPARYFVNDARRAIDLLADLPEVDEHRIGITGNSGGGTLTTLMMALEPRLAAAAPATYVSGRGPYQWTGQHQDAEQILLGGTEHGVDHDDLLAVMAPRPVMVLAATYDFFPIEATRDSTTRAQRIYRLLGAEDRLRLTEDATTHHYSPGLATAAADFFREALGPVDRLRERMPPPLPVEALRCTASGEVALDHPGARFIADLNQHYGSPREPAGSDFDIHAWLENTVLRHRERPETDGVRWLPGPLDSLHGFWWSERDIRGAGVLVRAEVDHEPRSDVPLHLVIREQGTDGLRADEPALQVGGRRAPVLALDVRAQGALTQSGMTYKLLSDLLWLGDSLTAGRVYDVLRAIDMAIADTDPLAEVTARSPVHVHGHGSFGLLAVLAGVLDDRITSVSWPDAEADITDQELIMPGLPHRAPINRLINLLGSRFTPETAAARTAQSAPGPRTT